MMKLKQFGLLSQSERENDVLMLADCVNQSLEYSVESEY